MSHGQVTVRPFMSLVGLLASAGQQVPLGQLLISPLRWHLKTTGYFQPCLEILNPVGPQLVSHLRWWSNSSNVLRVVPLYLITPAVQIRSDAFMVGWEFTVRAWRFREVGLLSQLLHINILEIKAVFHALHRSWIVGWIWMCMHFLQRT